MTDTPEDKTRIQVTLSPSLRDFLSKQAELRGQPLATVAAHFLGDRMIEENYKIYSHHVTSNPDRQL
jgi:hypothetical protein